MSFSIVGGGIECTFDLSAHTLDYPNMLPFDGRAMTSLLWAIDGSVLGGASEDFAQVYFDDVRGGVLARVNGRLVEREALADGFERGDFADQPSSYVDLIRTHTISLAPYRGGAWYLERSAALARPMAASFAHSGARVAVVDATLRDVLLSA